MAENSIDVKPEKVIGCAGTTCVGPKGDPDNCPHKKEGKCTVFLTFKKKRENEGKN